MTNKEAFAEFRNGAVFVLAVFSVLALFAAIFLPSERQPEAKFKVVDTYNGCDVVRYNRQEEGRYTYFLDCREVR